MKENIKCVDMKTSDGNLIFRFEIYDKGVNTTAKHSNNGNGRKNGNNGILITGKQKKYLFRLLTDQGVEDDEALIELRNRLNVEHVKEASKDNANKLIKELLAENNEE